MNRYSCNFKGDCEEDANGRYISRENCQRRCRGKEQKEVSYSVFEYAPQEALQLAPSDQQEITKRLTGLSLTAADTRELFSVLDQEGYSVATVKTLVAENNYTELLAYGLLDHVKTHVPEGELRPLLIGSGTLVAFKEIMRMGGFRDDDESRPFIEAVVPRHDLRLLDFMLDNNYEHELRGMCEEIENDIGRTDLVSEDQLLWFWEHFRHCLDDTVFQNATFGDGKYDNFILRALQENEERFRDVFHETGKEYVIYHDTISHPINRPLITRTLPSWEEELAVYRQFITHPLTIHGDDDYEIKGIVREFQNRFNIFLSEDVVRRSWKYIYNTFIAPTNDELKF